MKLPKHVSGEPTIAVCEWACKQDLSHDAVNAIKNVCMGVRDVTPQELSALLHAITE